MLNDWLTLDESNKLLGKFSHNPPVRLRKLPSPKLLWVNESLAPLDPEYLRTLQSGIRSYGDHLLQTCAYVVTDEVTSDAYGFADQYGGKGMGPNGGSARAALVGAYHIKGIGRTPLLGVADATTPNNGRVYLEEGIREVFYSEVLRSTMPFGTIPILALIDTNLDSVRTGGALQRRVLVVRPNFLRPAHLLRSPYFQPRPGHELLPEQNISQVRHLFDALFWGDSDTFESYVLELAHRWSSQLAAAFCHQIAESIGTPSNVTCNGALLDFGSTSIAGAWAPNLVVAFGAGFDELESSLWHLQYYGNRFAGLPLSGIVDAAMAKARKQYLDQNIQVFDNLLGVDTAQCASTERRKSLARPFAQLAQGFSERRAPLAAAQSSMHRLLHGTEADIRELPTAPVVASRQVILDRISRSVRGNRVVTATDVSALLTHELGQAQNGQKHPVS